MGRGPSRINPVSVLVLLLVVAGGYAAYRAWQVYSLGSQIEVILDDAKYEAAELDLYGGDPRADLLLEQLYDDIVALGLDEETTEVRFDDDFERIQADYTVVIEHPFGQTTTLERSTSIKIPREN